MIMIIKDITPHGKILFLKSMYKLKKDTITTKIVHKFYTGYYNMIRNNFFRDFVKFVKHL